MKKHTDRRGRRTLGALALLLATATLTACIDDDEPFVVEPTAGPLFDRYVALGNSLTAGFQSGGINVDLQRQAYPVLLADRAGAPFGIPALARPGCPPPLVGPLTTQRISDEVTCALRVATPPPLVQNLAVPGAKAGDVIDPIGTGTTLNTLLLGGRTQIQAMIDAEPTLVSVWLGSNDVLGASLGGEPALMTPLASFQEDYDAVVTGIQRTPAQEAVLIGVPNPMLAAPALQPGAYFWALAQSPPPGLPALAVSDNCAPFTGTGTPNPGGAHLVSFLAVAAQIAAGADPVIVDCSEATPGVLSLAEQAAIAQRVGEMNAYIAQQATANDWIYVDFNTAYLAPVLTQPDNLRKCQLLASASTPAEFVAAVQASCPVDLNPETEQTFFGDYVSFDGIHPSAAGHAVIADTLAGRLGL